ncbi:hypothetical protein [Natrinema sp. DC36]|uniref:DUF7344 domain-containing protein n=1 Tax=Natrinema sp. DC36 TaxID=2878680 RepID=UPI001CF0C265|nr:hypothetical protein [Natrinema sp. DC36]
MDVDDETLALFASLKLGLRPAEAHEIISNERRRVLIRELAAVDETDHRGEIVVDVSELAEAIAAAEAGITPDEVSRKHRRRVYIALLQSHAPLLDSYGVVRFFDRPKKIQASSEVDALATILEAIRVACWRAE